MPKRIMIGMTGLAVALAALTAWAGRAVPQATPQVAPQLADECEFRLTFWDAEVEGNVMGGPVSWDIGSGEQRLSEAWQLLGADMLEEDVAWVQKEMRCAEDIEFVMTGSRIKIAGVNPVTEVDELVPVDGDEPGGAPRNVVFGWTDAGAVVRLDTVTDRVGIGTAAPTHKLTVQHTTSQAFRTIGPGAFGSLSKYNFGDAEFVFLHEDIDDSLTIKSTGRTAMTGGFVGINTTSPDNRLDVNGKISVTQSAADEMVIVNDDIWRHAAGNQDFGSGGDHFIMASKEGSTESAGIFGDGNSMSLWSPGDGTGIAGVPIANLYFLDEDFWNADGNPYDDGALEAFLNLAGLWVVSDVNRKQNFASIDHASDKIKRISAYTYEYKLSPAEIEKGQVPTRASGLIAQEVKDVLPEAVITTDDGEHFLNYAAVVPLLVESIKDQIDANQRMAAQINEQNDANRRMAAQIADLTARLDRMDK